MANATPRDTRAGFDIFRSAGGEISLDAVNSGLEDAGYGPVSPRTYAHYRSLLAAGFERYVSINRFDVARAATPFENASASPRYAYTAMDVGVRVIFAKSNRLLETFGRATEVGEVGAVLRFDDPDVVEGLRQLKPQPGDMVTVRYLEIGRTEDGRVVDADAKSTPAVIEIEYAHLLSIASFEVGQPLANAEARFVLTGPVSDQTLDVTSRRIYHFFELIEGIRALSNRVGAKQAQPVYAEPPVLRSLSVASPADVVLLLAQQVQDLIPWALVGGVLKAAAALPEKRKQWYEGTGQKKANQLKAHELREKELEVELKDLEVAQAKQEVDLREAILARVRATFVGSEMGDEELSRVIDEFLVPPLRSLGRAGIDSVVAGDLETGDDVSGVS
ncbi:MAG TPA: hypothetical protein VFB78_06520 [Acidimicrobiales bacterium]|nr:hypothetical protein [Acidimicrobiales bacterium]